MHTCINTHTPLPHTHLVLSKECRVAHTSSTHEALSRGWIASCNVRARVCVCVHVCVCDDTIVRLLAWDNVMVRSLHTSEQHSRWNTNRLLLFMGQV